MVLTRKQESRLKKMPLVEARVTKSKDGKYLIHKVILTTLRPVAYYKAILDNTEKVQEEDIEDLEKFFE